MTASLPLDYETLRVIWWLLLGVLLIGFALLDGYDLGVGVLLPFVARADSERRVLFNLIGPTWEGNQVWLILGGGAIFAAWPALYAVSFSGFYLAMIAILLALILRPVSIKFRGKIEDPRWRNVWDWAMFVAGFVPALIFGVAVGNVLLGVPFGFDDTLRPVYPGNFFIKFITLLHPFAVLCGLVSLAMLVTQAAVIIAMRTEEAISERARTYGSLSALAVIVLFALAGVWIWAGIPGYVITSAVVAGGPSNPLGKSVAVEAGAWLANYGKHPWMMTAPALGFAGAAIAFLGLRLRAWLLALAGSSAAIFGIISTAGLSLFPFLLPSSLDPKFSLTVWDASSSHMTLFIMLGVTLFFLPIVIAYTSWVYKVMSGPVRADSLDQNPNAY